MKCVRDALHGMIRLGLRRARRAVLTQHVFGKSCILAPPAVPNSDRRPLLHATAPRACVRASVLARPPAGLRPPAVSLGLMMFS